MTFDPIDPSTWPTTLLIHHVAAIRHVHPDTISRKATLGIFHPAPVRGGGRGQRWEWRRADVVRFEFGDERTALRRVV